MDRHVRPSRHVDCLAVARHLRQEQEALGDEDERLLPPQPHQRLERLLQAAEADLGAAPDLRDILLLLDRGVGVADNGELAGTAARAGAGAGHGGGHPSDPFLSVLERAHPRPVAVAVAGALADEAADDARELPVLPGVARRPPQLLLRRDDGDPVTLAHVRLQEAAQRRANPLHRRVRDVDVVDEDQHAASLGRRAQAGTGETGWLVGSRRAAPAHDHRLEGLDGLRAALLLDHEVLAREARHRPLVLVENGHVEADQVDGRAEDRRRLRGLRRGLPATVGSREQESERAEGRGAILCLMPIADPMPRAASMRRSAGAFDRRLAAARRTGPRRPAAGPETGREQPARSTGRSSVASTTTVSFRGASSRRATRNPPARRRTRPRSSESCASLSILFTFPLTGFGSAFAQGP